MNSPLFFVFLFLHLSSLIVGFGSVLVIDTFGLLWLLKKVPLSLVNRIANVTQRLIWTGWSGMVLSGIPMILMKGYLDNLTKIKLFLVLMIGLNGIFLHYIKKSSEQISDNQPMPAILMFRITLATAISQAGWWGAIIIGFVHRHIEHNITWPANPWTYILAIAGFFGLTALTGESFIRPKQERVS